jgi:magnesium-transporting ATPase (P-type)
VGEGPAVTAPPDPLVAGCRDAGFEFKARNTERILIEVRGEQEEYKLLNIIQFNSTRKRMTVVVETMDGTLLAYCKGADTVMEELLSQGARTQQWPACDKNLHEFAKDGLRTLVLCQRTLERTWYEDWAHRYALAETALEERDEKVRRG